MAYRSIFLILFLIYLFKNPCYSETDTLHQGQELKDWDELISSNRVFSLKLFSIGSMVSLYLGIFYCKNEIRNSQSHSYQTEASDEFSNNAVWVANRNNPIPDIYGKLIIDFNGKLSILSGGGTVLDLFSPTLLVARNATVTLFNTGNLKLQELHPNGSVMRVLWQSFDYPTDTLLPGMKLGINLKTGHKWSLTAWRNDELPAEGLFTLDLNGTGQMVILRQGNIHWISGPWKNGRFENTNLLASGPDVRLHYVSNEIEQSFTYLTRTYDSYPALRMDQAGELEASSLNLNIFCLNNNDLPGCAEDIFKKSKCRKGNFTDSPITGSRERCYSYLDEYTYDDSYNLFDCLRICWSNCSCVAFATRRKRVGCKTFSKMVYDPSCTERADESRPYNTIITITNHEGVTKNIKKLLLHHMRRLLLYMRRVYNYVQANKYINTELHYFTFQSISSATNNFSNANKLGKGGFGEVYKGKLVDGQEIAVKRLSRSSGQGTKEFRNETELIAKLQHTNLVRLLGCCIEKQEKILVYEYMPNKSLDVFLFDQEKKGLLDWNSRFVIIDGIAQGLLYLHKFSRLRIIHRDMKASNILLDDYFKPKISDFGMAKLFGINESEANTSRVVGTRGYMPPEYLIDGIISTKVDVFSFGVLILEIVSSKMNFVSYDVEHPLNLLGLAWEFWNQGSGLELMDPALEDTCTPKEVMTCIHVALLCGQDHAMDRPTMSEVVSMLTNENMHLPDPKPPAFFIERHETKTATEVASGDKFGNGSENGESISILVSK
ncbi:hypothetical protein R6Q57_013246 [Mikania cordata]